MNQWIVTDSESTISGYTQFVKQVGEKSFVVIEHDDEYGDEGNMFVGKKCFVDLKDYSNEEVLEELKSYGYEERQDPQIEAECIAESDMELCRFSYDFSDILSWEENQGIYYKRYYEEDGSLN